MQLELLQHGLLKKKDNDVDLQSKNRGYNKKNQQKLDRSAKHRTDIKMINSHTVESRNSSDVMDVYGSQNQSRIKNVISKISGKNHHKMNAHVSTTINSDTQSQLSLLMVPIKINKQDQANLTAIHSNSNYLNSHKNHLVQKLQTIQSQKRQERYPQYNQDLGMRDQLPRIIKMKINLVQQEKFQHISFDYNLDSDTPEVIIEEMQDGLQLDQDDAN